MSISQNVRFSGFATPDDEFDHPAGVSIAKMLQAGLQDTRWNVTDFDNWRDCGWSLECSRDNTRLLIAFSQMEEGQWILQVAPSSNPGLLGRLFGSTVSSQPSETTELARSIHSILKTSGSFTDFMWTWDGFPEEASSDTEPQSPKTQEG